jgi:glycerophosphoryl diester phosphodiesterase
VPHPFFASSRPLVFAHRGGSRLAPENTIAAFENGLALGADGVELDVRLSRDGVVVVHHDPTLDRTTSLSGRLSDRTAAELSAAGVPALADVLSAFPRARLIVEMKLNTVELAERATRVVQRAAAATRVCLGSFGLRALRTVRTLDPAIATSAGREEVRWALYRTWCGLAPSARVPYGGYQVPERIGRTRIVSRRFVRLAHRRGLHVQVWTVDRGADAVRLLDWGVDALITDRPDLVAPVVRAFNRE